MRLTLALVAVLLVGGIAMTFAQKPAVQAAEKPAQVLRHIVLYKFKDDAKSADVQEVIDTFAALPTKIDGIVAFEHGKNVSPEGKSDGLTHVFVVSFKDEKARDAYLVHPAHQAYVNVVKDRREKVVVFDYWAAP
ncbi:MAG TPA: Dabb family protein [Pirellulales bacterium]|jgi:quinol monooxygenase YgiN